MHMPRKQRCQLIALVYLVSTISMMTHRRNNVVDGLFIGSYYASGGGGDGGGGGGESTHRSARTTRRTSTSSRSTATKRMSRANKRHSATTVVLPSDDSHLPTKNSLLLTTLSLVDSGSDQQQHDENSIINRRQVFSLFLIPTVMGTAAAAFSLADSSQAKVMTMDQDLPLFSSARFLSTESTTAAAELVESQQRQIKTKTTTTTNDEAVAPDVDRVFDWTASPLTLSLLAGLSTCLGAAVVFCARGGVNDNITSDIDSTGKQKSSPLTDAHMAFSLALAGSVMVTVSVVSILPQSFQDESYVLEGFRFLAFGSLLFVQRCCSFLVGCALYAILSKCAFPEPDAILGLDGTTTTSHTSTTGSDHDDDAERIDSNYNNNNNYNSNCSDHHGLLTATSSFGSHHDESEAMLLLRPAVETKRQHSSNFPIHNSNEGSSSSPSSTPSRKSITKNIQQDCPPPSSMEEGVDIGNSSSSRTPSRKTTTSIKGNQHIPYLRNIRPQQQQQQQSSSMDEEDVRGSDDSPPLLPAGKFLLPREEEADEEARGYVNKKSNKMLLDARLSTSCTRRLSRFSSGADLQTDEARRAWRVAVLLFISLAIHNFPEGLAVAVSSMHSQRLGVTTTIAIALHNIPEGIAIAVPCLAARPESPWLAFGLASLSGLAEPLGAFVAMFFLQGSNNAANQPSLVSMNDILAFVAGIMIMVAVSELFPEACRHSKERRLPFILGLVLGAIVMVGTELILS